MTLDGLKTRKHAIFPIKCFTICPGPDHSKSKKSNNLLFTSLFGLKVFLSIEGRMREGEGVKKKGVRNQRQMTEITMTSDWESELDKSGSLCETVQNTWKMLKIMRTMQKRMKTKGRKQSRSNKRREADRGVRTGEQGRSKARARSKIHKQHGTGHHTPQHSNTSREYHTHRKTLNTHTHTCAQHSQTTTQPKTRNKTDTAHDATRHKKTTKRGESSNRKTTAKDIKEVRREQRCTC